MDLASVATAFRDHPVAATLEYGSLAVSVLLVVGVVGAVATGPPGYRGGIWLAIVALGGTFVCFWTVCWPLYERLRYRS